MTHDDALEIIKAINSLDHTLIAIWLLLMGVFFNTLKR